MTLFWAMVALLIAIALALVLPSLLLGRSTSSRPVLSASAQNLQVLRAHLAQLDADLAAGDMTREQHQAARSDIERRVLQESAATELPPRAAHAKKTGIAVGLLVPLFAIALYGLLGNPQAIMQAGDPAGRQNEITQDQVEAMVTQLAQRLERPSDGQQVVDPAAWAMLARSYSALQRFAEADRAYARAMELAPDNAQLLADRADVLAMMQGQSAVGEPTRLVERALRLDPKNLKALALAGSAAYERADFPTALTYWSQALALAPPDSAFARGIDRSMQEVRKAQGGPAASEANQRLPAAPNSNAVAGISGTVRLSPELAGKVSPGDTVFIFARATQGPRMPLAILRHRAGELPIQFLLDDSTAMSSELRMSQFKQLVVGARVSRSGNALPQTGDFLGDSGPVSVGTRGLTLTINRVEP